MIAICIAPPAPPTPRPRIHIADLPAAEAKQLPAWLDNIYAEEQRRDRVEQWMACEQAKQVNRDSMRGAAVLVIINVLLAAFNCWLLGHIWARFG